MIITANPKWSLYKASVLVTKLGITLGQARKLKLGESVETSGNDPVKSNSKTKTTKKAEAQ